MVRCSQCMCLYARSPITIWPVLSHIDRTVSSSVSSILGVFSISVSVNPVPLVLKKRPVSRLYATYDLLVFMVVAPVVEVNSCCVWIIFIILNQMSREFCKIFSFRLSPQKSVCGVYAVWYSLAWSGYESTFSYSG